MEYNFDKVTDVSFCCIHELIQNIMCLYTINNKFNDYNIAFIAKGNLTEDLFKLLISFNDFEFGFVNFDGYEYDEEYILEIGDEKISVEPMVNENGDHLSTDADVFFIHSDCNYKAIETVNNNFNNIVIFGFNEECE